MRTWVKQLCYNFYYNFIIHVLYNISIKKKLYVITFVVTLIPIIVLGLEVYTISKHNIIQTENNSLVQSTKQLTYIIDFYFEGVAIKSDLIFNNSILQDELTKSYTEPIEIIDMYNDLIETLSPLIFELKYHNIQYSRDRMTFSKEIVVKIYSQNASINFLNTKGPSNIIIDDFYLLENNEWYKKMKVNPDPPFFWRAPYKISYNGENVTYISLNRELKKISTMEDIGVLSIEVPEELVRELLNKNTFGDERSVYLLTKEGEIVSKSDQLTNEQSILKNINKEIPLTQTEGFINNINIGGKKYNVYYTTSNVSGWRIICIALDNSIKDIKKIWVATITVCILSFIGAQLIMMILSKVITERLQQLMNKMYCIGDEISKSLDVIKGKDEIGKLDQQFNKMIHRINELIEMEYKVKLNSKLIEVELLQEQINPHMLYNTLSAIRWIASRHNVTSIYEITENLICFYKASLSKGNIFVSVSDEIKIIDEYISLNRRINDLNLDYVKEIDERVYNFYCIKLILQPAVENALIHGLKMNDKHGCIDIKVAVENDKMIFEVSDNGAGMEEETIQQIMSDSVEEKKGFGIYNVKKRIELFYGSEYGLTISSKPGERTTVKIIIPCCSKDEIERICRERKIF